MKYRSSIKVKTLRKVKECVSLILTVVFLIAAIVFRFSSSEEMVSAFSMIGLSMTEKDASGKFTNAIECMFGMSNELESADGISFEIRKH